MLKFLNKIKHLVDEDLNEFVKWIMLLGLYVFYRMMEKVYDEKQLVFLVLPLIFLGIMVFIIDWIIDDMILSLTKFNKKSLQKKDYLSALAVGILLILSLILFILFYIFENVELMNAGFFSLLLAPLLAKRKKLVKIHGPKHWTNWISVVLIITGLAGLAHAIYFKNGLNSISFIFYVVCIAYYFLMIKLYPGKRNIKEQES